MNRAYLLTGGNIGDRTHYLSEAHYRIAMHGGKILSESSIYETGAWGMVDQPDFLNQVLEIETHLTPIQLLDEILMIEISLGRYRSEKFGPRTIDIDILLYDQQILDLPRLKIPHPQLPNRRFALVPLSEIASRLLHPVSGKTIKQLLESCEDHTPVKKYTPYVENKDQR